MLELRRTQLLELFANLFTYLEEGVLLLDNDGRVVFYNRSAAALEGLQPEQAIGRHIDELYVADSAVSRALHQALLGFPSDDLLLTEFDDRGHPVRIQVQCYPLRLKNRQVGVLRLTRDLALWAPELVDSAGEKALVPIPQEEAEDDGAAVLSGKSEFAKGLQEVIEQLGSSRSPVIIWGPPGSGRSSLAKLIHRQTALGDLFLSCDFRFRSATAQEIMLLGSDGTNGLWQQAQGGSLLLEEVHLASPRLQSRLVEMLGQPGAPRCFLLLPGDPFLAMISGNLHPGLVERCVASIELLALAKRSEDLPQISQYLLYRINERLQSRIFGLTPLAKEALQLYPWPGGLRELHSVLEGAVLKASGAVITPDLLPSQLHLINQGLLSAQATPEAYPHSYDPKRFTAGIFGTENSLSSQDSLSPANEALSDVDESVYSSGESPKREIVVEASGSTARQRKIASSAKSKEASGTADAKEEESEEAIVEQEVSALSFAVVQPLHSGDLPSFPTPTQRSQRRRYGEMEKKMIIDALEIYDNDTKAAAKELHMRESTLLRRLDLYSISLE